MRGALCASLAAVLAAQAAFSAPRFDQSGTASWYGDELRGRRTANGELFSPEAFTAAHRTLPMSSLVEVMSIESGRTVLVRINDRGPFHKNRVIDLSQAAAQKLGIVGAGSRLVRIRLIDATARAQWAMQTHTHVAAARARDTVIPSGGAPYFIRVATFSSRQRARSMADRLGGALFEASGLYQVRLGPFGDAAKVNAALAPLAAKGYSDVRIVR